MLPELTTAFGVMGDLPWGTHFCYFYETKQDLIEASIPFFQAGLENHQCALWIVYAPVTEADALDALRRSIPDVDRHLAEGGIEVVVHPAPTFDGDFPEPRASVLYLEEKLSAALKRGYTGMRVGGSPACLQKASTEYFRQFERELNRFVANHPVIALCHFPLAESSAAEILDAARTHQFVLARLGGVWEIIEPPEVRRAKAEITKLNEHLEQRVEERTRALEEVNEKLRKEIARREQVEADLRRQKEILQTIFDHIPVMIGFVDQDRKLELVNREWERVLGWSLEEISSQNIDIASEAYPDPGDHKRVVDWMTQSSGEWLDFKTTVKDGRLIDTTWAAIRLSDGAVISIGQDISERKRVEQELRTQKEFLQTIFDHIPVMINFGDKDFGLRLINREWEQTLGWSLEEILRDKVDILVENYPDPEYRAQVRHFVLNSNGEWRDFKTTVRDGRVIDTSWVMLRLPDGTHIGIGQDITRRKQAEEALRESEERFRQIAENITDLFWIKTADFKRVLYLSPAYENISGRSAQERYQDLELERFLCLIHPEDRDKMAQIMTREPAEFDIEFRIVRGDGSTRWIHDRGFPIRDQSGQIYRMAGISRDVTERKLAEDALRESEERFRQLTENIREVFWLRSPDFKQLLYVSPLYEKVCGKPQDVIYATGVDLDAIHPDDRALVSETMRPGGEEFEIEYRIITKDGKVRWLRDRGFPIRNQQGEIYRIGGVAEDITERKKAEERLKASSNQLRALSASLQSAREEEATRIAHQIHDDVGGILTGLRWELEALEKIVHEAGGLDALKREMQKKLAAMLGLTDTTINVVRRIASELRPSILDDLGLMEAIEWQAEQFQGRTGIQCRCDCSIINLPLRDQESTAVFRIFQEALTNILRHAQATRVDVAMQLEDGVFTLTVTDNGLGISPAEKFSRGSLGILGMQERAHLIGGEVEIAGHESGGTSVRVRVPLPAAALAGGAS